MQTLARPVVTALLWITASGCAAPGAPSLGSDPIASGSVTFSAASDRFFASGDVRLRYREIGEGDPVLLLHGFSRSLEDWSGLVGSLASDYRVIAVDLRGFGQSSRFSDPSRYGTEMIGDLVRLLDHLEIERAHVGGHSMGALLAANLAQRHPERIRTLTLVAGVFRDSTEQARLFDSWITRMEQGEGLRPVYAYLFPMLDSATIEAANQQAMGANDRDAMLAVLRNAPPPMAAREVGRLSIPTLAIVGRADPLLEDTNRLDSVSGRTRVIVLEGANHGNVLSHPEFLSALRTHLVPH